MRKVIRWAFVSVSVLVVLAIVTVWVIYHASRQEPKFYQEALKVEPLRQAKAGHEFEHQVLELRNEARAYGTWEANFSAEQINAWLAVNLPGKFPEALPPGVEDPRVAIEDGLIRVAARFRDESVTTVLSFALEVQLTEESNTLAIRVCDVRAGALPVPMSAWLEKLQARIQQTKLNIRWSQSDGDPVAIAEIPAHHPDKPNQMIVLDSVAIESGSVQLAGRTGTAASFGVAPGAPPSAIVQRRANESGAENNTTQR
jgi:hypothetical protein